MKHVIISGGGTGGHVFPAIAIANSLKMREPGIGILFIGALGRMEMTKVPEAGYAIEGLNISGFQRRLTWKNLSFPFKLAGSLLKARSIIAKFKPDLVIGVGGYASGPTLRMATMAGIPALIQEQNSFPGVTNRLLGGKVQKICVAYEGMEKYFPPEKLIMTGNPIRREVMKIEGKRDEALRHFGLGPGKKTLLVIGGSLGAGTINQAILKFVQDTGHDLNIQALWQTGKHHYDTIRAAFAPAAANSENLVITPFIDRMDLAYAAADIIVSRAGAIAISELCVVGKPVILVPSPNVAEDHQTKNARALESRKAAILVPDPEAVSGLGKTILDLLGDEQLQADLKKNISAMGITDAADKIAGVALSLIGSNNNMAKVDSAPISGTPGIGDLKSIYFLGIGGIGMSALARYFASNGASIAGYDKTPTALTDQLAGEGMKIHFTEDINLLPKNPDLIVYTPAIPADHKEFAHYKALSIPMKKRSEVLGMISQGHKTIAIAGTHGKTTTSAMLAHILITAGMESMAFLGGIPKNYGTNFLVQPAGRPAAGTRNGKPETLCVVEADEYDKSFLHLNPFIAVITSADADHLDIYGNHDDMRRTFAEFTSKVVENGALVMKSGTRVTPELRSDCRAYSYAVTTDSDFYASNIRLEEELYLFDFNTPQGQMKDFKLGVPGKFNLENAVAALSAGCLLGAGEQQLRIAMAGYAGVHRRFDFRVRRPNLVYIDDYAHHPEELRACISSVRELYPARRLTGVFQPHLFSRTRDLADDFARSLELLDELVLLEIYPAREKPIAGVTSQLLLDRVNLENKRIVPDNELVAVVRDMRPEILLTLGAGDIDRFAGPITKMLERMNR